MFKKRLLKYGLAMTASFRCEGLWSRQESNLDLELRKLLYYPLYYETNIWNGKCNRT